MRRLDSGCRPGFLVVAITFPKSSWPDAAQYNNGHVLAKDGTVRLREAWSLANPGRVFRLLRASGLTTRPKTFLCGHSAGGQFVYRLVATQPLDIFEAVGTANSGWYTLPTLDWRYPEGLGGIGQTQDDIARRCSLIRSSSFPETRISTRNRRTCPATSRRWRRDRTASPARNIFWSVDRRRQDSA